MKRISVGLLLLSALLAAQSYQVRWSVVGTGGGDMASAAHQCGSTVGQTAAGLIESPSFLALIGYWQGEVEVGIADRVAPLVPGALVTGLEGVAPNPFARQVRIRYALATESDLRLRVCDLAGRVVRDVASVHQPPGRYEVLWRGEDDAGRLLANGVYFVRFEAAERLETGKLMLLR